MAELTPFPLGSAVDGGGNPTGPAMSAVAHRWPIYASLQEGVVDSGDLKVTPGTGLAVNVAAGIGMVQADYGGVYRPGLVACANDASKASGTFTGGGIGANATGNPRLDMIVCQLEDAAYDGGSNRQWRLKVIAGTPTASAQIDDPAGANYRAGAAALPNSALLLADVLVPAGSPTSLSAGDIVDRRKWARGAYKRLARTAGDVSVTSTSYVNLTGMSIDMECSGSPLTVGLQGAASKTTSTLLYVQLLVDGASVMEWKSLGSNVVDWDAGPLPGLFFYVPSAGRHTFTFQVKSTGGGSILIPATASVPLAMVISEDPGRQNTSN